jgi:hypothetical protein
MDELAGLPEDANFKLVVLPLAYKIPGMVPPGQVPAQLVTPSRIAVFESYSFPGDSRVSFS